jgi:hypothetical protein
LFQWGRYYENDGFDAMVDLVASSQGDRQRQTSDMSPLVATGKAAVMATDSDIYPLGYVAMSPPDAPQSPLELSEWAGMI